MALVEQPIPIHDVVDHETMAEDVHNMTTKAEADPVTSVPALEDSISTSKDSLSASLSVRELTNEDSSKSSSTTGADGSNVKHEDDTKVGDSAESAHRTKHSAHDGSSDDDGTDIESTPMPLIINMDDLDIFKKLDLVTKDDLPDLARNKITYEALLYNRDRETKDIGFNTTPVATYRSRRPFNPRKDILRSQVETDKSEEEQAVKWTEDVFKIRYSARARMPWLKATYPTVGIDGCDCEECNKKRREAGCSDPVIHNEKDVPTLPADHDIVHWSNSQLVITSPHLMLGLYDIVQHWPGIDLLKPTLGKDWEAVIAYPYTLIAQHLKEIREFLDSPTDPSAAEKSPADEDSKETKSEDKPATDEDDALQIVKDPALAREHLGILYEFIKPFAESRTPPKITAVDGKPKVAFEHLWHHFAPGTLIYVKDAWTKWYTAVVHNVATYFVSDKEPPELSVWVWYLSSDGATIARCLEENLTISHYTGQKDITELPACPVDVWEEFKPEMSRKEDAIRRGSLLEKAFRSGHMLARLTATESLNELGTSGNVVIDHRRGQDRTGLQLKRLGLPAETRDKFADHDKIYVNEPWTWSAELASLQKGFRSERPPGGDDADSEGGKEAQAKFSRKAIPLSAEEVTDVTSRTSASLISRPDGQALSAPLTDQQKMLLYPLTFGFSLKTKQWVELDASRLEELVPGSDESLNRVVIPEDDKEFFKALAARLTRPKAYTADHIAGKGTGGIILLHGPPGVGKTYTVEAIAEMMHRPLLALTVADIGTKETLLEYELSKWFALAELWQAVLLIDEADIFLERRETKDLQRNGLVSAFLRRAEYFNGLLFLTTNRVGLIDDAFISRIHVPIQYHNLKGADLAQIWKGFFEKLNKDKNTKVSVPSKVQKWIEKEFMDDKYTELNGRDIRNALQTAITLAEFEHEEDESEDDIPEEKKTDVIKLTQAHFEKVLKLTKNFRQYVYSIRQQDQAKRAKLRQERNDYEGVEADSRDARDMLRQRH